MEKTDAILISSASNVKYFSKYFNFSDKEREAFILKTKKKNFLITDKRYSMELSNKIKDLVILNIGASNFILNECEKIFKKYKIRTLGVEENDIKLSEYNKLKKYVKIKFIDTENIRILKRTEEIENIKLACKIGDKAFNYILKRLETGISEKEISNYLIKFIHEQMAEISFNPIVAFGKNSSIPHHDTSNTKLKKDQIILFDFGVKINNYCSDMSRTVFYGKANDKFKKIYNTTLKSQELAIKKTKVNIKASLVDKTAREFIISQNYPNIIHALGHGIGIDVHEPPTLSPNSNETLKNNMVFTIEPGIYIAKYGGVRIEDVILLENNKTKILTIAPKKLIEIKVN